MNRVFPYANATSANFAEDIDSLFQVVHRDHHSTSVLALMLFKAMNSTNSVSDRFYTPLYVKLIDPKVREMSNHTKSDIPRGEGRRFAFMCKCAHEAFASACQHDASSFRLRRALPAIGDYQGEAPDAVVPAVFTSKTRLYAIGSCAGGCLKMWFYCVNGV
ncbi:hypothetical protein DVH05_028606 [Phytophthora capsici]|nr:hypothetical protein DVH05_028606 [Phytophthora capsici]